MSASFDRFLTATCTHKNNPTGAASLSTVQADIACTPLDPTSTKPTQDYPIEKLFLLSLLRETFTEYANFAGGDFLEIGGVEYPVVAALPWAAQGGLDAYYHIIVEMPYGS
jgi:hypothetical protein